MAVGLSLASRSTIVILRSPSVICETPAGVVPELVQHRAREGVEGAQVTTLSAKVVNFVPILRGD